MTTLNDRFAGLSVNYRPLRSTSFSLNKFALGFINAVKIQAIEDCEQYIRSYTFTDTEYEDSPIRIRINAAAGGPEAQLVRCNVLYAMKTLAINQLSRSSRETVSGGRFIELYHDQSLYDGVLDNKNDVLSLENSSNLATSPSGPVAQTKRALSTHPLEASNSTISFLTIPGLNDVEYTIEFKFRGTRVLKVGLFSAILGFIMTLAQLDSDSSIDNVSQSTSADLSWIYVMYNSESNVPLKQFQLVAILESIARYAVMQRRYEEMTFDFHVNGEFVAGGCVTVPDGSKAWCRGLREGSQRSLVHLGNTSSSLGSDLIPTY